MLELDARKRRQYLEQFLGKETEILIEERLESDGPDCWDRAYSGNIRRR